jgi:hypothetical protein
VLFVIEDLGVGHAGAVIDGGVQVAVADAAVSAGPVGGATSVHSPSASVADRGELLDVDVDEFSRPFALIAPNRLGGGPVTAVDSSQSYGAQDRLDRRRGQAQLETDVIRSPSAGAAPMQHPLPSSSPPG